MIFKNKQELIEALHIGNEDYVLDIGFVGQAVREDSDIWPHALLKSKTDHLYGVDLEFDQSQFPLPNYLQASAEYFSFSQKFDLIFAGDLIEHLSNPGLFLMTCKKHLKKGGRIVLTTPNAFNMFSLVEKITHDEPNVNTDHTCYFNKRVLAVLMQKNGIHQFEFSYLYTLGGLWKGGFQRKVLASLYWIISKFTPKFIENLAVIATV